LIKTALCAILFISFSALAEVKPIGLKDGSLALYIQGRITPKDAYSFKELIQIAKSTNQVIRSVYLDSPGGDVRAGYEIALLVRNSGILSFVPTGSICASSCFMVFMAGNGRFHGENVKIGVHSASDSLRQETDGAMSATVLMSRFLSDLGTPPAIIGRLVTARPSEIAWLSGPELQEIARVVLTTPSRALDNEPKRDQVSPRTEVSRSEKAQARNLNAEAITSLKVFNYSEAIPILKRAAQLSPYDAEIQGNLGFAMFLAHDFKNARDTLALALGLKKNRSSTWVNLGQTVAELGDLDWATTCFKNYLQFSSNKTAATEQLQAFRDRQGGVIGKAAAAALDPS
jgi:hypothetical protein